MRVLDLDLDFFLDGVEYFRGTEGRRLSADYHPWDGAAVRGFLEQRCGLRRDRPVPGRLVKHHHQAFLFWRERVRSGTLDIPFDVVHVDAHPDLGLGDAGYDYLMTRVLRRPVEKRPNVRIGRGYLGAGNYLAFAAACRWIKRIVYVANPRSRDDDLLYLHFKNFDTKCECLQLKGCDKGGIDASMKLDLSYPFDLEPEVPFKRLLPDDFRDTEGFSLAVLCHSPGFTPVASDALIPLIMEYLQPV